MFKKLSLGLWMCLFLGSCAKVPEKSTQSILNSKPKPTKTESIVSPDLPPTKPTLSVPAEPILTQLPEEIDELLKNKGINSKGLSVYIQAVSSNTPILSFNADVPRNPASVMKMITTYTALGTLGADYRWLIELYTTGKVVGNTLKGDLILKGYGYPDFNSEDLRELLTGLRARGIVHITGNLIFDNSYFALPEKDFSTFDNKPYARYNALPDALLYNQRISDFIVKPQGKSVAIYSETPSRNVNVINHIKLKNVKCRGRYARPQIKIRPETEKVNVYFSGVMSNRCGEREFSSVISDPANMLYASIRRIWMNEMRGTIKGTRFIEQAVPMNARLVYGIKSKPVKQILPLINKKSNNVMARQLFLSIAAKKEGMPATTSKGSQAIQEWLSGRGLDFPELKIENGSGLSRTGQITTRHIAELLLDAYRSPYKKAFLESLAIMGVDGTLKRRMRDTVVAKRGRFKTGTLRNVRAIAGYLNAIDGKTYIVAILHNDPKTTKKARGVHDKLIEWTATQAPAYYANHQIKQLSSSNM